MAGEIRGDVIIQPSKWEIKQAIVAGYTSVVKKVGVGASFVNSGEVSGFYAVRDMRMR